MNLKRVVVTGLGALTPIGNNISEYWNGLIHGVSGAAPITYFDASNFKTQFACEVKGFNVEDFIDRKEARKMDRYAQYAIVTATEAMEDANFDLEKLNQDRKSTRLNSSHVRISYAVFCLKKKKKKTKNKM